MNQELEELIWNYSQDEKIGYSQETWLKIIDALLNDFQEFIGHKFERNRDIFFELEIP